LHYLKVRYARILDDDSAGQVPVEYWMTLGSQMRAPQEEEVIHKKTCLSRQGDGANGGLMVVHDRQPVSLLHFRTNVFTADLPAGTQVLKQATEPAHLSR
jgi:hypothetical protein